MRIPLTCCLLTVLYCCYLSQPAHAFEIWLTSDDTDANVALTQAYQERTGDTLDVQVVAVRLLRTRLALAQQVGHMPTALVVPSDQLAVPGLLPSIPLPEVVINTVDPQRLNGRKTGVMLGLGHALVLYYNRQLLPQTPETWEALLSTSEDGPVVALDVLWPYLSLPFMASAGLFDEHNRVVCNPMPAVIHGLEILKGWYERGLVPSYCSNYECAEQFVDGRVAAVVSGTWDYERLNSALGDNLGFAPLPDLQGEPMQSVRFPLMLTFLTPVDGEENAERVSALLDGFESLSVSALGQSLYGAPINAQASSTLTPYEYVAGGSFYSPSDQFLNALLIALPQQLAAFMTGELPTDVLAARLKNLLPEPLHCDR